jgi:hypothetical protein
VLGWFRRKLGAGGKLGLRAKGQGEVERLGVCRMWYRFVTYREGAEVVSLGVDVMVDGPDIVGVPSEEAWARSAPGFARDRREEIVDRLKRVKWNRELV